MSTTAQRNVENASLERKNRFGRFACKMRESKKEKSPRVIGSCVCKSRVGSFKNFGKSEAVDLSRDHDQTWLGALSPLSIT
jgi:hypothetical protein